MLRIIKLLFYIWFYQPLSVLITVFNYGVVLQKNGKIEKDAFQLPPITKIEDGSYRKVGFELEFSGMNIEHVADTIKIALNGDIVSKTAAEIEVYVDSLGKFNVELDWEYLKNKARESGEADTQEFLEYMGNAASFLVPVEIVCPPIPVNKLDLLTPMMQALQRGGAEGTEKSILSAYGVHINIEAPSLKAETLFTYIRAFSLLQWWLVEAHDVDMTRKITPYIDLYPDEYLKKILSTDEMKLDEIFESYFEFNATRNRALDMLPLLAFIDKQKVLDSVDDTLIKERPTFHYRLPNCQIERKDWSLSKSWNIWNIVEKLAVQKDGINELSRKFLESERLLIGVSRKEWVEYIDKWLQDQKLV